MGVNISCIAPYANGGNSPSKPRLGDIPESCVALVLMYLDPTDICQLATLNRAFHGASTADFVWESKLPSNYRFLIEKLFDESEAKLGKKNIYGKLCRPIAFDDGTKKIWLEKKTGGVCLSISSKALTITGIDDRRYWNHISTEESRFQAVAYLQQIWWFEADGEIEFQFPAGTYSLFFRLQLGRTTKRLGRRVCNSDHIHGWDLKPVRFQLSTSDDQHVISHYYLDYPGSWVHYHVGDFIVEKANALTKIKFSATQIDCTHTKGGLCVDSVLIYPRNLVKRVKGPVVFSSRP